MYDLEYLLHERLELLQVDHPVLVMIELYKYVLQLVGIDLETCGEALFELLETDLSVAVEIEGLEGGFYLLFGHQLVHVGCRGDEFRVINDTIAVEVNEIEDAVDLFFQEEGTLSEELIGPVTELVFRDCPVTVLINLLEYPIELLFIVILNAEVSKVSFECSLNLGLCIKIS